MKWIDREIEQNRQAALAQGIEKGMEKGMEKGREEGIEKGIEKGAEMTKLEMARRLLLEGGFSLKWIAKLTGLSLKQVEQLKPQPN